MTPFPSCSRQSTHIRHWSDGYDPATWADRRELKKTDLTLFLTCPSLVNSNRNPVSHGIPTKMSASTSSLWLEGSVVFACQYNTSPQDNLLSLVGTLFGSSLALLWPWKAEVHSSVNLPSMKIKNQISPPCPSRKCGQTFWEPQIQNG